MRERVAARNEYIERKENAKQVKLKDNDVIVSMGPHQKGSPIVAKEKRCILNLYQSFLDDGDHPRSPKEAREETAKRLQFGINSVQQIIKEMNYERNVTDNKNNLRSSPNAYEKLDEEEEHDLRQLIHNEMRKCNVSRLNPENEDVTYPTIESVHKAVMETGIFPNWSISTFRNILYGMNIKFKAKSEVDRAILIEDDYIIEWRKRYLSDIAYYRSLGYPIHFTDETFFYPLAQPRKILTDNTVKSAQDAEERGLSPGIKWNAGDRGNRLLVLHMIGPNGLLRNWERIWIHKKGTIQSEDYHNDITFETFLEWFMENIDELPQNSVIVIDNASIHNKRPDGSPNSLTKKAELQAWLIKKNIYFKPKAKRPELWKLAQAELKNNPEYAIDKLVHAKRPDIIFLRLPPYHCELNAIEPV